MKYKEIKGLSEAERKNKLSEAQKELIKLNGQVVTGTPPKSPGKINQLKKDVARLLTFESALLNSKNVSDKQIVSSSTDSGVKK